MHLCSFVQVQISVKRYWSSLFDFFVPSYFLITNMRVATEQYFLLCILVVAYSLLVLDSWSLELGVLYVISAFERSLRLNARLRPV